MLMHNYFIFNGIDSSRYGIRLSKPSVFGAPERDQDVIGVPGHNGDVINDNGRWKNRTETYECSIVHNFKDNFTAFREAILAEPGYHRLEDTYHPDEYYIAALSGPIEPNYSPKQDSGSFKLTFTRKPQRWLKSGEIEIERINYFPNSTDIYNPTRYESHPLIKVNCGSTNSIVTLYVGGTAPEDGTEFQVYSILETAFSGDTVGWSSALSEGLWAYLDSENGEAYAMYEINSTPTVVNLNQGVKIASSGKLPAFPGGEETHVENTSITGKFTVTPRWYTL